MMDGNTDDILARIAGAARGKAFLSFDELNALLPPRITDVALIEDLLATLEQRGVRVGEEHERPSRTAASPAREAPPAPPGPASPTAFFEDPLRPYLQDMGRIAKLSAEDEAALLAGLKRADARFRKLLTRIPAAAGQVLQQAEAEDSTGSASVWFDPRTPPTDKDSQTDSAPATETAPLVAWPDAVAQLRAALETVQQEHASLAAVQDVPAAAAWQRRRLARARIDLARLVQRLPLSRVGYVALLEKLEQAHRAASPWLVVAATPEVVRQWLQGARQAFDRATAARQRLVETNLRLVVSVARHYNHRGLNLTDLIQEGNLGLLRAAERFTGQRNERFASYATWWIRRAMAQALSEQPRLIRLPAAVRAELTQMLEAMHRLTLQLHREPNQTELAQALGFSLEKVQSLLRLAQPPVSLETPVGDEEETTLGDFIADAHAANPLDDAARRQLRQDLDAALQSLNAREEKVLRMRFGLDRDGRAYTLEEVAQFFALPRDSVRRIEADAMRKLRHPARSRALRQFLEGDDEA
ncbi:MAG: sigma-70 family RNA polymerase sigma factor [Chloracidobacterium sp.]|uniref:RNA polymerase sigma factor n=1 Tax=Chloracidobacterium validum TaxID=2821543 RepID=A0ABX8BBK1_9BACT|nr:sigma-70 family RNA polymerase sigma factor [Chloracidobacterium validum]QUW03029.1 sigma-70 family RNA polymerase sigma factor [Chloracidobacterium validum]